MYLATRHAIYSAALSTTEATEKRKNYAGSESHSPHYLKKKSHFGTEYRKAPPPLYTIHHIHMVLAKLKHGTSNDDQISDSSDTWLIRHITCTASTS